MNKAEDLARKYCEGFSFEDACMEKPAYIAGYRQAEKDLEIAREEVIDRISHWIEEHCYDYLEFGEAGFGANLDYPKMINDLKKAMEDKVC